jgi:hypothetical protein
VGETTTLACASLYIPRMRPTTGKPGHSAQSTIRIRFYATVIETSAGVAMNTSNQLSIRDAALATGLNPSVIRVWEDRYGWPSPRRHPNGYRSFTRHEVEQLKRIAVLVKAGTPISSLIVDGFPEFPADRSRAAQPRLTIVSARALPGANDRVATALRDALCQALEDRHLGHALEVVQRARLDLRPLDELRAVLLPALVGLAELHQQHHVLAGEQTLIDTVRERRPVAIRSLCWPHRQRMRVWHMRSPRCSPYGESPPGSPPMPPMPHSSSPWLHPPANGTASVSC